MTGDPHAHGAHGDRFDFKGNHLGIYVLLSTKHLSLAAKFERKKFYTPFSKLWVHGSWIRHAYWTIWTTHHRLVHVTFDGTRVHLNGSVVPASHAVDDVDLSFTAKGPAKALTITNRLWRTRVEATKGAPHWGKLRMSVQVQPLYDITWEAVSPHGILGQTYDADNLPLHGNVDDYSVLDDGTPVSSRKSAGGVVTTKARGEGAIEGTAEMYRIGHPFETRFPFSRFGAEFAKPRNITLAKRTRLFKPMRK